MEKEKLQALNVQKEDDSQHLTAGTSSKPKPSFRIVGRFVMAMRRFQSALNPTYDYGDAKRQKKDQPAQLGLAQAARAGSGRTSTRTGSGKTLSGRPDAAGRQHGYKGNLLFKPLPKVENEEVTSQT